MIFENIAITVLIILAIICIRLSIKILIQFIKRKLQNKQTKSKKC